MAQKKVNRLAKPEIKGDIIVKRIGIQQQFTPTLPKSTFHDYVNEGLIKKIKHGQYLLNASLVSLKLKPLSPEELDKYQEKHNKRSNKNAFNPRELCIYSFTVIIQAQEPAQCLEGVSIEAEENIITQTFSSLYNFAKSPSVMTKEETDTVHEGYLQHKELYYSCRSLMERIMYVAGSLAALDVMRLQKEGYFDSDPAFEDNK